MRLRDHQKLRWRGSPVWPPPWAGPREPGSTGPIAEQGFLREAQLLGAVPPIPARLALVIEYEGRRFTGVLFVDDADFLVRLHETFRGWAIPLMFPHLVQGIQRSLSLDPAALEYFQLHINLDVEHGKVLQESLLRWATTEANQNTVRRGARRSLEARAAFWSALAEELFPNLLSMAAC